MSDELQREKDVAELLIDVDDRLGVMITNGEHEAAECIALLLAAVVKLNVRQHTHCGQMDKIGERFAELEKFKEGVNNLMLIRNTDQARLDCLEERIQDLEDSSEDGWTGVPQEETEGLKDVRHLVDLEAKIDNDNGDL